MKKYNHTNTDLISEQSLAILHKNAKNTRIEKYLVNKKQKRDKALLFITMTIFFTVFYILAMYV